MAGFRYGSLRVEGQSRAGSSTWLKVTPPGIAFDVGRGSVRLSGVSKFFLSHTHLDHVLGLPFVLAHRGWQSAGPAEVYCPAGVGGALGRFLESAAEIEGEPLGYSLRELEPGESVEVSPRYKVVGFATDHVVPSLGYHLIETRRGLRSELEGLEPAEIAARKRAGQTVEASRDICIMSYGGDMGVATLDSEEALYDSQVLALECTFLGEDTTAKAERFKHLHLDHLIERRSRFRNERILLLHLSRRHSYGELRKALDTRLPELADRMVIFPFEDADRERLLPLEESK